MARANPANRAQPQAENESPDQPKGPVIEYFGEGADKVEFTADENAKLIRVYSSGMILIDY